MEISPFWSSKLQQAIVQLFNPETDHLPETALLFFAGHGLRDVVAGIAEGYLAISDANPNRNHYQGADYDYDYDGDVKARDRATSVCHPRPQERQSSEAQRLD